LLVEHLPVNELLLLMMLVAEHLVAMVTQMVPASVVVVVM